MKKYNIMDSMMKFAREAEETKKKVLTNKIKLRGYTDMKVNYDEWSGDADKALIKIRELAYQVDNQYKSSGKNAMTLVENFLISPFCDPSAFLEHDENKKVRVVGEDETPIDTRIA